MIFRLLLGVALGQDADRGRVLAGLGNCAGCHTADDGEPYAGGHAIETTFGTFYGTNLTPDPEHGIGQWTREDFVRAMRRGRTPRGASYYTAFPFAAFTGLTDRDLDDLWAYLGTLEPSSRPDVLTSTRDRKGPMGDGILACQ